MLQKLSVKVNKTKLNFFTCLCLSRNTGKTEDSVVQSGSRAPVQASPDMLIAANYYVYNFAKKCFDHNKNLKSIQKFLVEKLCDSIFDQ
jgi:hypothetical protein